MIKDENMEKLWRTGKLVVPNFNDYINKINKKSKVVPVTNNYFIVVKFLSRQLSREVWEQKKKKHKKATGADFIIRYIRNPIHAICNRFHWFETWWIVRLLTPTLQRAFSYPNMYVLINDMYNKLIWNI